MTQPALHIDVVSDVVCPWCFIGKRQLEGALQRWALAHPDAPTPTVTWLPFQLNPDMPDEGIARSDYLQSKFGHSDVSRLYQSVAQAAKEVDLQMDFAAIARQPNTLRPHALIAVATGPEQQSAMVEQLFTAYFMEGRNLVDPAVLQAIAAAVGYTPEQVQAALTDDGLQQAVRQQDLDAREAGIGGVPFFVINRRMAVSGAQGTERLLRAFEKAASIEA